MRRSIGAAAVVLAASVSAVASERHGLIVAPGAVNVVRGTIKGAESLDYYMRESYPATNTLTFLKDALAKDGWEPATGPGRPRYEISSHEVGWREIPLGGVSVRMRLWSAVWLDAGENEVTYTLTYDSPLAAQGLQPAAVGVEAFYRTKQEAMRLKAEMQVEMDRISRSLRKADQRKPEPCAH